MPTFVFLKDGKEVDRLVGARKEDLQATITKHATATATATAWGFFVKKHLGL